MNSPPSCRWTGRAELACGCRPGRPAPWRNTTPILASRQVGAWLSLAAGWLEGWCSSPWLRERPDLAATAALPDQTAPLASGLLVDLPRERRRLPPTSAAALIPHTNQLPPPPCRALASPVVLLVKQRLAVSSISEAARFPGFMPIRSHGNGLDSQRSTNKLIPLTEARRIS